MKPPDIDMDSWDDLNWWQQQQILCYGQLRDYEDVKLALAGRAKS